MTLAIELIDTHAHLTHTDYAADLSGVLEQAKAAGVTHCVVPGLDFASSKQAIELAKQSPMIIPAIGLHPLSPAEDLEPFRALALLPEVKAIGEVGTDSKAGDWGEQEARFRFFLELAIATDKPVLIHIRDTWEPTLKILADYPNLRGKAVIHCFTGGEEGAKSVANLGILLSFTAIIARSGMDKTRNAIKDWPLEQMMLETDGPWLSWPGDSWPNEPKTVAKIAEFIAKIKGVAAAEVAQKTTQTARNFFNP